MTRKKALKGILGAGLMSGGAYGALSANSALQALRYLNRGANAEIKKKLLQDLIKQKKFKPPFPQRSFWKQFDRLSGRDITEELLRRHTLFNTLKQFGGTLLFGIGLVELAEALQKQEKKKV